MQEIQCPHFPTYKTWWEVVALSKNVTCYLTYQIIGMFFSCRWGIFGWFHKLFREIMRCISSFLRFKSFTRTQTEKGSEEDESGWWSTWVNTCRIQLVSAFLVAESKNNMLHMGSQFSLFEISCHSCEMPLLCLILLSSIVDVHADQLQGVPGGLHLFSEPFS